MYRGFYGLREKPFALSPDPKFLYLSASHREALAHLLFGIEQGEGFIVITGEVGTGKTTLCRALLRRLTAETEIAFIFNPMLSPLELLQAINGELGLVTANKSRRELSDQLNRFLLQKKRQGRRVVLLVDEAQNLERDTLEEIRLLSNLETETSKLIQIVLIGQPELDAMLESPALRQLRQRVSVRWRLAPLSQPETREYVNHRLRIAAGESRDGLFTEMAHRAVHQRSGGIPRLVNLLCDRALLAGYGARAQSIGVGLVNEAERELRGGSDRPGLALPTPAPQEAAGASPIHPAVWAAAGAGALLIVALVLALVLDLPGRLRQPAAPAVSAARPAEPARGEAAAIPVDATVDAAPDLGAVPATSAPSPGPTQGPTGDPTPVPVEPAPQPEQVVQDLRPLVARSSPGVTAARSLAAALELWRLHGEVPDFLTFPETLGSLVSAGLQIFPLLDASLDELSQLNHPVLIPLQAPDGAPRTVLVTSIEAGALVTLAGLSEGRERVTVPRYALEQVWQGQGYLIWNDFEVLPDVMGPGLSGESVTWLQNGLVRLGYYPGPPSGVFDGLTISGVRALQQAQGLDVDGTVGPLTKIALYDLLTSYAVPRLTNGEGEAG